MPYAAMMTSQFRPVAAVLAALTLVIGALGVAACSSDGTKVVTFRHAAVTPTSITLGVNGEVVGTQRTFHDVMTLADGSAGYFDGIMVTTASDATAQLETRITTIIFSTASGEDQLTLQGSAKYPATGSTIKISVTVIRPVIGGSGEWAGARGWAESTHEADGSWTHTFHLTP